MMKIRLVFPVFLAGILLVILLFSLQSTTSYASYSNFAPNILTTDLGNQTSVISPVVILIDDFVPQPNENQSDYIFNRLEGNRGLLNDAIVTWGQGKVTSTITDSTVWGGIWLSLNHRDFEKQPFNFSAILPAPISSAFQSKITTLTVEVAGGTAGTNLKLELKNDLIQWVMPTYTLSGGQETISYHLNLSDDIYQLALVHDKVVPGDFVTIENLSFEATTQITDTAQAAFVWSYGMLLNNWNPTTGLIRDSAKLESGIFDGIQSTGSLAAATAMAYQLGVVNQADAIEIISKISNTLLLDIPRYHGLWPHWVISSTGAFTIVNNTEWSSVDTVIAAIALLDAQVALNLDTISTTQLLQGINWDDLKQPNGISHGYKYDGSLITSSWDTFGGESWLVALAYAAAKHEVPPLKYPLPPTANGSGFIDELAWLLVMPPSVNDVWGVD